MDRRRFLATSLAEPLVVPLAASAQPSRSVARVGFLGSSSLPALAAELVRLNPDVLVVAGAPAAHDAKQATRTRRLGDLLLGGQARRILDLTLKSRLPSTYSTRQWTDIGLMAARSVYD